MSSKELLKEMEGCEIWSLMHEGCVGIIDGKAFCEGEKINLTPKKIKSLWKEYIGQTLSSEDYSLI